MCVLFREHNINWVGKYHNQMSACLKKKKANTCFQDELSLKATGASIFHERMQMGTLN